MNVILATADRLRHHLVESLDSERALCGQKCTEDEWVEVEQNPHGCEYNRCTTCVSVLISEMAETRRTANIPAKTVDAISGWLEELYNDVEAMAQVLGEFFNRMEKPGCNGGCKCNHDDVMSSWVYRMGAKEEAEAVRDAQEYKGPKFLLDAREMTVEDLYNLIECEQLRVSMRADSARSEVVSDCLTARANDLRKLYRSIDDLIKLENRRHAERNANRDFYLIGTGHY